MTDRPTPVPGELVYYPNASDEPVRLIPDPRRFTVRFGRKRDDLSPEASSLLRHGSAPVAEIPRYGLSVFELDPSRERRDAIPLLNGDGAVELAAPVLHRERLDADDVYVTSDFLVAFKPEVTREQIDALNAEHGVEIVEQLHYVENGFLLRAPAGTGGLEGIATANAYRATGLTIWAHPDLISRRHRRVGEVLTSTAMRAERDGESYVSRQWHLDTARVTDAWSLTRGSSSINVAILDDGMDVDHPELSGKVVAQFDFDQDTADARPKALTDNHGTACSGVAVASGLRASGAAPGCSLIAVRFPSALGDSDEARMFTWAVEQGADVISCSWGPQDGLGTNQPLPGSTQAAIHHCVTTGRGGKGTPVLFAAGNGDESVDLDGYAANPDVMAIAASNDHEVRSWYSDFGDAVWVCAPSNGDADAGEKEILTIDRPGASGYNDGSEGLDADYTGTFGGTSSATPLVAGIVGLMLSANPQLTVTEVRTILRNTAHKIDSGYDANGHSPKYGYGRVDAFEAVRAAQAASGGVTPTTGNPSIIGPATVDRADAAPSFEIDPGGGPASFYAVEVATRAELLDDTNHGSERDDSSFYASWQDSPMQAANPYQLPDHAWERLRGADRLFYRAWFSSSADAWTDVVVTTEDADAASAPSISITGATRARSERMTFALRAGRIRGSRVTDPDELLWRRRPPATG